jgi:cytochrome c peroxidase
MIRFKKIILGTALFVVSHLTSAAVLIIPTPLNTAIKPPMEVKFDGVLQPTGINSIVANQAALVRLGKALFWDTQVGSDGMACASCHFHAGADSRNVNQINPGLNHAGNTVFDPFPTGAKGPNSTLTVRDFPMWQFTGVDPLNPLRQTALVIDDVISSAGTFNGVFVNTSGTSGNDVCTPRAPDYATKDNLNTRFVEPRNTPTTIGAGFLVRNFWDGRANRVFNGVNPFGLRDPNARVFRNVAGVVAPVKLEVNNASTASQAVGPVLSNLEMSCQNRAFLDVAAKIVAAKALANQKVSQSDSVLASLVAGTANPNFLRANVTYRSLIQAAFKPEFYTGTNAQGIPLEQSNFAMYFGLAVAAYENTLVAGNSKFDTIPRTIQNVLPVGGAIPVQAPQPIRLPSGVFRGLTRSESRGLDLFMGVVSALNPQVGVDPITGAPIPQKNGRCILCHNGPEFTTATFTALAPAPAGVIVPPGAIAPEFMAEPMPFAPGLAGAIPVDPIVPAFDPAAQFGTYDLGFYDIGVTPLDFDHGLGGNDPWNNPLAFAKQWENAFNANTPCPVSPLGIVVGGAACTPPTTSDVFNVNINFVDAVGLPVVMTPALSPAKTDGSFKTPSLRNVALTAPYFHNGSAKTLEEALQVYNNGGLFINPNHHPEIIPLAFDTTDITDVANFLRTLTDNRVTLERAPFDHPELLLPNGHKTDVNGILIGAIGQLNATDNIVKITATGRLGRTRALPNFEQTLAP